MKKLCFLSLTILMLASSASSFEGLRKGFVLGGGLGFTPSAEFRIDGISGKADNSGAGLNIVIGYGWDEQNLIVAEVNGTGYKVDPYDISQGFFGASWYHYFGEIGKSFFTNVGLGTYNFSVDEYDTDPGGGILIGCGYEFAKHWQVAGYFGAGKTSESNIFGKTTFKHNHLSILVSGFAF